MELEDLSPYSQGLSVVHILSLISILRRINQIPYINIHFFKIHFKIVLPSTPRPF